MSNPAITPTQGDSPEILLVEDIDLNAMIVLHQLKLMKLRALRCHNGKLAVELWQQQSFRLILMDIFMPVMDGIEATRTIRSLEQAANRQRTPIFAITANAEPHSRNRCLQAGMDKVLAKPVSMNTLFDVLSPFFP